MCAKIDCQLDFCIGCDVDKQCKSPFQEGDPQNFTFPLELVHTYLCGLMKTTLVGEAKYFIIFMNDNTRMLWTYFLKQNPKASGQKHG